MQLDDLDFADDLVLLSQTQQQMQEKTTSVAAASAAVGLNIHKRKSKILRYNTACTNPITIDGEAFEDVKTFTYLGSIIDEQGGSDANVKTRIGKARAAYLQLRNIWNSKQLSTNTKQQPAIGENKADFGGGRSQEEALEVDRTHIEESTQLRRKTSPHMKPTRPKGKRKTKEHITPRNGDRHQKNEQELDRTGKEGPGQSGLKNAGGRPMLHLGVTGKCLPKNGALPLLSLSKMIILTCLQGDRDSLVSADGTNVEDMLLSMLDERDRLMEGLRESQEQVNETRTRLNEVERERDKLHAQLSAKMPQDWIRTTPKYYYGTSESDLKPTQSTHLDSVKLGKS
ncbi:unnamed protein product [Schistosoma curassoni]|uniref:Reverse transcriptase domain-containing protein n=1 Tax=Schistosoma curassoni TaxID=6186 RepID=A0A183KH12_9TREM|nr:unnamed protein product [Schistosoma curassoni]